MNRMTSIVRIVCVLIVFGFSSADAQERIAEQAYQIFQAHCMTCHGAQGTFKETLRIDRASLIESGTVVPGDVLASEFYRRLTENTVVKPQMPLGTPPLSAAAIDTVRRWILAGAPEWDVSRDVNFITPEVMLKQLSMHLSTLPEFDRPFARYFTMTHLYNAGESPETLHLYRTALSKLVNSLSWGSEVINPQPIDALETLFYIDLRKYEWEISDAWGQIETVYPYTIEYAAESDPLLFLYLTSLREGTDSAVPFVHVDWFLATASLPPLYHDILDLPATDRLLEADLDVNVKRNLQTAPGVRVWRAGFNDSGVSNHNRVVERHTSRYGAYWKSYDFAGSSRRRNIYTYPLSFQPDGGEIVFHLPNGLQAYLIVDANGQRIDVAPTSIVSNPQASDPAVHNGLSCIGCHTEGMKPFTDTVRAAIRSEKNPLYDKAQALRLYVEKTEMNPWIEKDAAQFQNAIEATGAVFGGLVEPVSFAYEAFIGPVSAPHAAAAVGLETDAFLTEIREKSSLQSLGLLALDAEGGNVKRDAWTTDFQQVITALKTEDFVPDKRVEETQRTPSDSVAIPDPNLRTVIEEALGKASGEIITVAEMETLTRLVANAKQIQNLEGIQFATGLEHLTLDRNNISDISPFAGLTQLEGLYLNGNNISDFSPLVGLTKLETLKFDVAYDNLSTLPESIAKLQTSLYFSQHNRPSLPPISDLSPLARFTELEILYLNGNNISDISPLAELTKLFALGLDNNNISDVSPLSGLTELNTLGLKDNNISDISPLTELTKLWTLDLRENNISDISLLKAIREKGRNIHWYKNPGFREDGVPIEGSWLWVVVPETHGSWGTRDALALASGGVMTSQGTAGGTVTELEIAKTGATLGRSVGDHLWTAHKTTIDGHQRIGPQLAAIGMDGADSLDNTVFGCTFVDSPREQETTLFVPQGYGVKVWVNGVLLSHTWRIGGLSPAYVDFYPVTLKAGRNILFFGSIGGQGGLPGFAPDTEYTASIESMEYTFSHPEIYIGDTFTIDLSARNVIDLAGWQFDIAFDPAVLEAVEVNEGDFLKEDGGATFFQKGTIDNTTGKITKLSSARLNEDGATGTGTLLSVTFIAKTGGGTQVALENFQLGSITGETINAGPHEVVITIEGQLATGDVNRDGQVSVLDMILIARHLGKPVPTHSDVDLNGDGVINILDLILVSQNMGESSAAAPSLAAMNSGELNATLVQAWITQATLEEDGSIVFQQGLAKLRELLVSLLPKETAVLANYPNPFNPETWIPYQLATPADVTLTIFATNGQVVRELTLGHQPAGVYQSRSRAVYWNGRNESGEPVASGVYFYTLTAGDVKATRKLLIRK